MWNDLQSLRKKNFLKLNENGRKIPEKKVCDIF